MLRPTPDDRRSDVSSAAAHRREASGLDGRRRPLLPLVLAAAIPVLFFGSWVAYVFAQQERAAALQAASDTVERVAERVASDISTQIELTKMLAASAALDRPDLRAFYAEAQRFRALQSLWYTIELADPVGMQVLNLLRPSGAPLGPTADRDSFEQVVRTGRPIVGGIGPIGSVSGRQLVALRVPVMRDGTLRHVLSVALAPDGISAILRGAGAPGDWIGAIVDARGHFIARTVAEGIELGRFASPALRQAIAHAPAGLYRGRTLEGAEVDTVYRTLPDTGGWSVHFGIPSEQLDAPVRRSAYLMVGGGLASLVLAAVLASITAHDIAQRRREEAALAAAALKASEERGAVAVEAAALGTWRWDRRRGEVVGSQRCRALLDLPCASAADAKTAWRPRAVLRAVHPDDRRMLVEAVERCLREDVPIDVEFRAVRRDGGTRWLRATGRAERLGPGEPGSVHGVIADIEPHKRAEAERLDLLRRLAQAQEEERRRIARELHDQVGQTVTGLSLGLKGLERALEGGSPRGELHQRLQWLQALAMEIGQDIHRAAADLRPAALDDLGLHKALLACASAWSERSGVAIDVQMVGDDERLPTEIETAIYRAVQEALTNVLKHAGARNVSIVLERKAGQLRVIVEDDGEGFDPEAVHAGRPADGAGGFRRGLGLSGIRERLTLIGGTLTVESARGAGTALFIQVPVAPGAWRGDA